jgi:hypothetical protein
MTLSGSAGRQLSVTDSAPGGQAIVATATAATGDGVAVYGTTDSSGTFATGVFGWLTSGSPGYNAAGVFGQSGSTTADGPGVEGLHTSGSGTAPAVLGATNSSTVGSAGVKGTGGPCGFCIGVNGSVSGNGIGVRGQTATGNGWGVEGIGSVAGIGVYGHTPAASTVSYGVEGVSGSSANLAAGLYGQNNGGSAFSTGVYGSSAAGTDRHPPRRLCERAPDPSRARKAGQGAGQVPPSGAVRKVRLSERRSEGGGEGARAGEAVATIGGANGEE